MADTGVFLSAAGAVVAGVVWLVRLEGRINVHDALFKEIKEDVGEIKADVKALLRK